MDGLPSAGTPGDDPPESQVDALADRTRGLRHAVQVVMLRRPGHQQHAAVTEFERRVGKRRAIVPSPSMPEPEPADGTECHGGDHGIDAEFRLVVCMPAHAVAAVAIEIEQDAVVRVARQIFDRPPQRRDVAWGLTAREVVALGRLVPVDPLMGVYLNRLSDLLFVLSRYLNRADGLTILLIEHVMRAVMALAQHIVVLHHGEIIARGAPQDVVKDPAVLECYLGEEADV